MKKMLKSLQSMGKVLLITFWDAKRILQFLDHEAKVNADHYLATERSHPDDLQRK
jgi:hypothetical protein